MRACASCAWSRATGKNRDDYPGAGDDWELQARKQWSSSPNVRARSTDYPLDLDDADMVLGNFNGVGGGTVLYSAVWPRLLPSDFRTGTDYGIGDDWPLTYEELLPHYEETDRQFGVSGLGGNPTYPPGADPRCRRSRSAAPASRSARAHARARVALVAGEQRHPLGRARGTPRVRATGDVRFRAATKGAKGSTDVTHWPQGIAPVRSCDTGVRVRQIEIDGRGRARGVTWLDAERA